MEEWPVAPEAWRAGEPPPDDVVPLLGIWFMEAGQIVFRWRDGKLEAALRGMPDWEPPAVFEKETDDRWRTVSGPEHGEALRIVRGEDGAVERLVWAGYPVTREPGPWRAPEQRLLVLERFEHVEPAARRAGRIAATSPTIIAAITNTMSVPRDREGRVARSPLRPCSARTMPTGIPSAAPIRAVTMLSCRIMPAHLPARHPDGAEHPELARPLEHRQHERVHDPEQADDDREREQDVEEVESVSRPCSWLFLNSALRRDLRFGERLERVRQLRRVRRRHAAVDVDEGVDVLRVLVLRVESLRRDRDVSVRQNHLSAGRRYRG